MPSFWSAHRGLRRSWFLRFSRHVIYDDIVTSRGVKKPADARATPVTNSS